MGPSGRGEQVLQVVAHDRIMGLASTGGLSEAQVTSGISTLLPMLVNELTTQGTVLPHDPSALGSALGLLKSPALKEA